jgi:hypothetical protein
VSLPEPFVVANRYRLLAGAGIPPSEVEALDPYTVTALLELLAAEHEATRRRT